MDAGATHDLLGPLDLGGLPRVSGDAPDIGAFEFQHPAPTEAPDPSPQSPEGPAQTTAPTTSASPDGALPLLSLASLKPHRFPAGSRTARLQFTLSERATLAVAIVREHPGRRSGRRCLKPSRKLRKARRCTRLQPSGSLEFKGVAGANSVPFTARGLKPGSYRLTLVPTDAAGNRGNPATARFQIVARPRKR